MTLPVGMTKTWRSACRVSKGSGEHLATPVDYNIWRVGLDERSKRGEKNSGASDADDLIPSTSNEFAPQYSPDGKKIAFESERSGSLEIWICQSDGAGCSMLTSFRKQATALPHWSPDGRQLVFYSRPNEKGQIYVMISEGGGLRQLTNDAWDNFFPVWSRDGRWIYFSSNRTGTDQIWKMPSRGGDRVQVTKNGGFASMETTDGKYLYYTQAKASFGNLRKMPVEGVEPTEIVEGIVYHNFAVMVRGLYYMTQPDVNSDTKLIHFLSSEDHKTPIVATINQKVYVGFSLSPDERWSRIP
jgi:Tol biopolymer transport system component